MTSIARVCRECGTPLPDDARYGRTYCSVRCRERAHSARQRAAGYKGVHYNHALAPTLDHVIPLVAGGAHAYANIQLAHRECNTRKRDGVAQLRWDL